MVTDYRFDYIMALRFQLAKEDPALLTRLDKENEKEHEDYVQRVASNAGVKIKFFGISENRASRN